MESVQSYRTKAFVSIAYFTSGDIQYGVPTDECLLASGLGNSADIPETKM